MLKFREGESNLYKLKVTRELYEHLYFLLSAGADHTVALKTDLTVLAVGENEHGQCDVSHWRDIVAVCCGDSHTVALKKDGTLVSVENNINGRCNVQGWELFEDCDFEKVLEERKIYT